MKTIEHYEKYHRLNMTLQIAEHVKQYLRNCQDLFLDQCINELKIFV